MISISDKRRIFESDIDSTDTNSRRLTRQCVTLLSFAGHPSDDFRIYAM